MAVISQLNYAVQLSNLSAPNNNDLFSSTPIRTILKQDLDGTYLLLAVNMDNRSLDVRFSFSKQFNRVGVKFESDNSLNNLRSVGQFTYHFAPFDTNVFYLSGPPGDYNRNGVVDGADYVVWRKSTGQAGAGLAADGNGDDLVNSLDYNMWRNHFGESSGGGAASGGDTGLSMAVPESANITAILAGCIVWAFKLHCSRG